MLPFSSDGVLLIRPQTGAIGGPDGSAPEGDVSSCRFIPAARASRLLQVRTAGRRIRFFPKPKLGEVLRMDMSDGPEKNF